MKVFKFNDQVLPSGVPFEIDGVSYPWNWFDLASPDDLKERGFTADEVLEAVSVPETVSPLQARLVLIKKGLFESVSQLISQATDEVKVTWEFADRIHRNNPILKLLATQMGLSDAQLDELFIEADKL